MRFLRWLFSGKKPKPVDAPVCQASCPALITLTAAIDAMKVQVALCLELTRITRDEAAQHYALLLQALDNDKTPPFGRPIGIETPPSMMPGNGNSG